MSGTHFYGSQFFGGQFFSKAVVASTSGHFVDEGWHQKIEWVNEKELQLHILDKVSLKQRISEAYDKYAEIQEDLEKYVEPQKADTVFLPPAQRINFDLIDWQEVNKFVEKIDKLKKDEEDMGLILRLLS